MGLQDIAVKSPACTKDLGNFRSLDNVRPKGSAKDSSSFSGERCEVAGGTGSTATNIVTAATVTNAVSETEAMDEEIYDDDEESFGSDADEWETEEGRLSRALQRWMPDYVLTPVPQLDTSSRQPVFSARLGVRGVTVRRSDSSESTDTQISLFSCSSYGSHILKRRKRRGRRKKTEHTPTGDGRGGSTSKPGSAAAATTAPSATTAGGSRWEEFAKQRQSELNRFMKSQTHALSQGFNLTEESEAFRLCDKDEQKALFECGRLDKLAFATGLKKSGSMTNIKQEVRGKPQQRVTSASAKKSFGKPVDFQELKRQLLMAQRLAASSHKSSRRRSLHRTASRQSLFSTESREVYMSVRTPTPPSSATEPVKEKPVTVWKGDSQILAIDLNRELTTKVKRRIAGTTIALERVTGMGDNNEPRMYPAHLDEFPSFTEENFAMVARIPQKIRISPHLSDVIKNDIKVRMGRPRYHEIREEDLQMWNSGLSLNRAHRNLKVFNWLHSLREEEFDANPMQQTISDVLPDEYDTTFGEMVLIKAVDEPDIRPLLERIRKNYIK